MHIDFESVDAGTEVIAGIVVAVHAQSERVEAEPGRVKRVPRLL
jgi:hypothetical protein